MTSPSDAVTSATWAAGGPAVNFSMEFNLSARDGKLWIAREEWRTELKLKGANWAGFQASGCVHELWKHSADEYIAHLASHGFNAVRIPLSSAFVRSNRQIPDDYICGRHYENWRTLSVLDDVVKKLRVAGLFVMLDVHTLTHPEHNQECWCIDCSGGCSESETQLLMDTWRILARRYCAQPNVIMADS